MAYYRKRAKGWSAEIEKLGVRETETFPSKAEAIAWATVREAELLAGKHGKLPPKYVTEALIRYATEVSIKKKGARWETLRLAKMGRELAWRDKVISQVTATDIADWRDDRLKAVQPSSVNREWNLLLNVFEIARREWLWLKEIPFTEVKRPTNPAPRVRRVRANEQEAILSALTYRDARPITTKQQRVAIAFQLAIESGMRASELCRLLDTDVVGPVAYLNDSKNSDRRAVPLSPRAMALITALRAARSPDSTPHTPLLELSPGSLEALYRKARGRAASVVTGVASLHFHDTRHEACSRLAKIFTVLELARILGHRDLKSLQIYYNPTPEELAAKFAPA